MLLPSYLTFVDQCCVQHRNRHEKSVEAMGRLEAEIRKPVASVKGKARKADTVVPLSDGT